VIKPKLHKSVAANPLIDMSEEPPITTTPAILDRRQAGARWSTAVPSGTPRHDATPLRYVLHRDHVHLRTERTARGLHPGRFIHDLKGRPIGQLNGTHVHKLRGPYVGELDDQMVLDKRLGSLGNIGNAGNPGTAGNPGNPRGPNASVAHDSERQLAAGRGLRGVRCG
jgi:hypothetical protein